MIMPIPKPHRSKRFKGVIDTRALSHAKLHLDVEPNFRAFVRGHGCLHEPVPDFCAPSLDQIARGIEFVDASLESQKPVVVTCGAGIGRTATFLTCYLVHRGIAISDALDQVHSACNRQPERPVQRDIIAAYAATIFGK